MTEIAYAPIETLPAFEAPQLQDIAEVGIFGQRLQELGKRAATLILTSVAATGLVACEGGDSKLPDDVKGMVIANRGDSVELGTCTRDSEGMPYQYGLGDLKSQGLDKVKKAVKDAGCGATLKATSHESNCDGPSAAFIKSLKQGDVVVKTKVNKYEKREDGSGHEYNQYCDWITK